VGKIEPSHIHTCRQEPGQDVAVTGRAQGTDDLGASLVAQHGGVTSSFLEKPAYILRGKKFHTLGKKTTPILYRIAENYNSKKTAWVKVDKLLCDINLLIIKL
jgi:hypothetical protein